MSGTIDGRGTIISHNTLYDAGTQTHDQLEASISVINSAVSGINTNLAAKDILITANADAITAANLEIDGIDTSIATINGNITTINGEIDTLQADVAAIVIPGEATATVPGTVYGSTQGGGNSNMTIGYNSAPNIGGSAQFTTAMGYNSMATTSALACWHDSAFGADAMAAYITGTYNSAFGSDAGSILVNGNNNTFIGGASNTTAATSNDRIALGYGAIAKLDNEFAIAPAISQWRSEGLTDGSGFMTPMAISSAGIIRKMPNAFVWGAQVTSDYPQAISSGGSNTIITGLNIDFGNVAYLSGASTFTVPVGYGFPTDGLWEVSMQTRLTGNAAISSLNLELFKNATTAVRAWETPLAAGSWITRGGTTIIKLSPGDTIQMRMGWTSSSAVSITVKALSTYMQLKYLGASGM
jgi:hypothetical protein